MAIFKPKAHPSGFLLAGLLALLFCASASAIAFANTGTEENATASTSTACPQLPEELTAIARILQENQRIRSQFTQKKKLAILKKPLLSHGKMFWDNELGLAWILESPLADTTIILQDGRLLKTGTVTSSNANNPHTMAFSRLFLNLMSGDLCALNQQFAIDVAAAANAAEMPEQTQPGQMQKGWHIVLSPKNREIKQLFARVELSGQSAISHVRLVAAAQDASQTDIRFEQTEINGESPLATEKALFD